MRGDGYEGPMNQGVSWGDNDIIYKRAERVQYLSLAWASPDPVSDRYFYYRGV